MRRIFDKLRKLRGRSLDEWRVRGRQRLAAGAERRGWSGHARLPDDDALARLLNVEPGADLLAAFRARRGRDFFASFGDREATVAALRRLWPERADALARAAERNAGGVFDLLGLKGLDFGSPVDWHLEPLSGKRSPLVHWSRIGELDAAETGDKKIVWELNRHQHFVTLGRAYWLTGDERHAEAFVAHVTSWMDQNPPKLGLNWLSSLEVAFRAVSWLWALHFFRDSPRLAPELFGRLLKHLYLHARHLETYLSTYSSPNTHLTGEALGLYYLGRALPEFRAAARWRDAAERILLDALPRHVLADGVYFEQSSYYQRYTADFYTHFYVLAGGDEVASKLQLLLDHLMHLTRPDGTTPLVGDDDGGKLLKFDDRRPNDFRAALANGAALFGRPDYKFVAGGDGGAAEETLWLLGPAGLAAFERLDARAPAESSRAFRAGGYYVMRDGWGPDANYLLLDCGPHGTMNCGHAHADALAFDLSARGRTLLVDPGTYVYTASPELRDYFRGTAAHNTLTLDGEPSSVPAGPFAWSHIARASARTWLSHARFDYFEGVHDGYLRLPAPARHVRGVLFIRGDYWVVRDRVETSGAHRHALRFRFAPGAAPCVGREDDDDAPAVRECGAGGPGLTLYTFGEGAWAEEEGWVSDCYAAREAARVVCFAGEAAGPREFVTFLVPHGAGESARVRVREVEAAAGRAFEVSFGEGPRDLLLFGGPSPSVRVGTEGGSEGASDFKIEASFGGVTIEADGECAWLRAAARGEPPAELILVGGRSASVGGREIINVAGRVGYAFARRRGGEWSVEPGEPPAVNEELRARV